MKELTQEEFKTLCKPLIKYLNDNHHPHTHIVIDSTRAELSEWIICIHTEEFLKD